MKNIFFLSMAMLFTTFIFAQDTKYTTAMKSNIAAIDSSFKNPSNLLKLANNFERIANSEKNKWLPYYYAAFCQVNYGFMQQDKTACDAIADKANGLILKADSLMPKNSEISCIESMIASCHMLVNPMQRWMQYGKQSGDFIDAAIKQDSTNPRPYYLKGQGLKYTPEQFGGGCKTAKPILETSLAFYKTFKPANELNPTWGKDRVEAILKECK